MSCRGPCFEVATEPGPPPSGIAWNPWTDMPGQYYSWTCSACATEWTERACGADRGGDVYSNREQVTYAIGYPYNINSQYGLMDGSGSQLQRVLREHAGLETGQDWLSFDQAMAIYSQTFGLMSGAAFYHWVAVRGVQSGALWLANSAEGYKGVYSTMNRDQYNALGGFSCIWVPQ